MRLYWLGYGVFPREPNSLWHRVITSKYGPVPMSRLQIELSNVLPKTQGKLCPMFFLVSLHISSVWRVMRGIPNVGKIRHWSIPSFINKE